MRQIRMLFLFVLVSFSTTLAQTNQPPPPPRPLPPTSTPPTVTQSTTAAAEKPNPPFVMRAPTIRPTGNKTGYSLGVWGGGNVIQGGDWTINGDGMAERGNPWLGAGVKVAYTWPFSTLIDQFKDEVGGEGLRIAPSLEAEGFWIGSRLKPYYQGTRYRVKLDSAVFAMNFLLKGQAGKFRPYAGPGLGLAAIFAHDYNVPGRTKSKDDDIAFAFQMLAGCDYFITTDWSIFAEYRYLQFHDAELYNTPVKLKLDDLEQHLFSLGLRTHF